MEIIEKIINKKDEEEGGYMYVSYFPQGYIEIKGGLGDGGYEPPEEDGCYDVDREVLMKYYAAAKKALAGNPSGTPRRDDLLGGFGRFMVIKTNKREVEYSDEEWRSYLKEGLELAYSLNVGEKIDSPKTETLVDNKIE